MSAILESLLTPSQRREADAADAMRIIDAHRPKPPANMPVDDGPLTEAEELEQAREELACTPGVVTQWLNDVCCTSNLPLDPYRISRGHDLTIPQLLVAIMAGQDFAARQAVYALRQHFERHVAADIAEYAKCTRELKQAERGLK